MSRAPSRVCHVITMLELGGAQQNTLHTVRHLDRARFEPSLVTGAEGPLVGEARSLPVETHFLEPLVRPVSPSRDLAALLRLKSLFGKMKPAIVHTHSSKAGILGRAAAFMAGVPVVIHSIHGWGFHPGQGPLAHALYVNLERLAARATTAYIAVSRANIQEGLSRGILRGKRVELIRSGIALERFRPGKPEEVLPDPPWAADGDVVVGMIGCFKPQKAPLDFIRVAGKVLARAPWCRFVLVGDGELRGAVEKEIDALRLGSRITLTGWRRDIPELMRRFDILLHTSRWEGLPRVFPEAMATGLPIVATSVDGAPEAVEEGVNGFLLPAGDIQGMSDAVVRLAEDPDLRRRMGEAGTGRAGPWDIDRMVRDQEKLYEELLR